MLLDAYCVLFRNFYKLNTDCVFYPAVTGELMTACLLLLWTLAAMVR
jgi:hypothetical protein